MADIFLSYAREDHHRAEQVVGALESVGWTVWWDKSLTPADNFRDEITVQLHRAGCAVVLWSRESVRSRYVVDEADRALHRGVLVQAKIQPVVPPLGFGGMHITDMVFWGGHTEEKPFIELRRAVERYLVPPSVQTQAAQVSTRSLAPQPLAASPAIPVVQPSPPAQRPQMSPAAQIPQKRVNQREVPRLRDSLLGKLVLLSGSAMCGGAAAGLVGGVSGSGPNLTAIEGITWIVVTLLVFVYFLTRDGS
jgi:hypothetical protein